MLRKMGAVAPTNSLQSRRNKNSGFFITSLLSSPCLLLLCLGLLGPLNVCLGWISRPSPTRMRAREKAVAISLQSDFFGLTEDGDFAIAGVNCNVDGKEQKENDDDNFAFGLLGRTEVKADILKEKSSESNIDEVNVGLTNDGDFLMAGINSDNPEDADSRTSGGDFLGNAQISSMNIWNKLPELEQDSVKSQPMPKPQSRPSTPIPSSTPAFEVSDNTIDEDLSLLEEFLSLTIPSLSKTDIESYAKGLAAIGYDPDCITSEELRFEDLAFMKILHRRYFYREITGLEAPS